MPVVIGHKISADFFNIPGVPTFNPMMLLHGDEKVEIISPVEPDSTLVIQETLIDLQDKKKATVMVIMTEIKDKESGDLKAKLYTSFFIRGIGGFG